MKIPAIYIYQKLTLERVETYQTDTPRNSSRKCVEDVNGWAQPLGQPLIATVRFVKLLNLIFKDGDNGGSRIAVLQLGCKRMGKEVLFGLLLVGLQGSFEDSLEA